MGIENYQPSEEEIKSGEEMMNLTQKAGSEIREEHFAEAKKGAQEASRTSGDGFKEDILGFERSEEAQYRMDNAAKEFDETLAKSDLRFESRRIPNTPGETVMSGSIDGHDLRIIQKVKLSKKFIHRYTDIGNPWKELYEGTIDGKRMSNEDAKRVFDKYYDAANARTVDPYTEKRIERREADNALGDVL